MILKVSPEKKQRKIKAQRRHGQTNVPKSGDSAKRTSRNVRLTTPLISSTEYRARWFDLFGGCKLADLAWRACCAVPGSLVIGTGFDFIGRGEKIVVTARATAQVILGYIRIAENVRPEIKKLAAQSRRLPHEIFEVAHRRATGEWPKEWTLPEPVGNIQSFTAHIDDSLDLKMEKAG